MILAFTGHSMNVRQLEILNAVVASPTLTQAARSLQLSPGAVSLQLQALSSELGVELFVRSGKKLVPTPLTLRLAEQARNVLGQMERIKREFSHVATEDARPFHFATGATTLIYRLGRPLRALRKRYPTLDLHVTVAATEEIAAGLLSRQFDLGLISLPFTHKDLHITPLFDEELVLLRPSSKSVRGNQMGAIKPSDLIDKPFLFYPPQSNMRTIIDHFFHELGVQPKVVMEAADTEAIKRMVESGFGYSILPEHALKQSSRFYQTFR